MIRHPLNRSGRPQECITSAVDKPGAGNMKILAFLVFGAFLPGVAPASCFDQKVASAPDGRYQDNSDGTITDLLHGLEWKRCSEGLDGPDCSVGSASQLNWAQALQLVESINTSGGYAGHSDWRLPNLKELATLIEIRCEQPAINENLFPGTLSDHYWTSSPSMETDTRSWTVDFDQGNLRQGSFRTQGLYVRLVRGG